MKAHKTVARHDAVPRQPADHRWAVVERIAASPLFEKSSRLREFLFYICQRSFEDSNARIHEHEVGCDVFGRPPDFDSNGDTIVRVHASRLRRCLEQYFNAAGRDEPLILSVPKGGYNPVWESRDAAPAPKPELLAAPPPAPALPLLLAAVSAVLALACVVLAVQNHALRSSVAAGASTPTALQQFWQQFWAKDRRTTIVLSDANLSLWTDLTARPLTLSEYMERAYETPAGDHPEPARIVMQRQYTGVADALIVSRLARLAPVTAQVLFAREAAARQLELDNVILLGSRRSNPWVEMFSRTLNFHVRNAAAGMKSSIENLSSRPGEPSRFERDQGQFGYCHVAFVPNLNRGRNVVIIAGTEMQSTEAGGGFLTTEHSMSELQHLLHVAPGAAFPYFELVLQTTTVGPAGPAAKVIAYR